MARQRTIAASFALALISVLIPAPAATAAQWPDIPGEGPQWPNVPLPSPHEQPSRLPVTNNSPPPQWPSIAADALERAAATERRDVQERRLLDSIELATGSIPTRPPAASFAERSVSPYTFEFGSRYWFSTGNINFGFANGNPAFGNPTSTLDWNGLTGHSGEIFARIDHRPSGVFVKGLGGLGKIAQGEFIDRDFLVGQIKFSDTFSEVHGSNIAYGIIDVGWAFDVPEVGARVGMFAGYHYWREKATAYGVRCNADDIGGGFCGPIDAVRVGFDVPVLIYEPTWHALRLGADFKTVIAPKWSVAGEAAFVPFAILRNEDSHLLRQSPADLGPAPNIITKSSYAIGGAAELFVNYALTPNIDVGTGFRYWGMYSSKGSVQFGPTFANDYPLRRFEEQRYGLLLQIKGKF